jgi:hypothetical protein
VHFQVDTRRIAGTVFLLSFLVCSVFLAGCSIRVPRSAGAGGTGTKTLLCAGSPTRLNPAVGSTASSLPPSHDNDAGLARIPDAHPDADVDANQIPPNGHHSLRGSNGVSGCYFKP